MAAHRSSPSRFGHRLSRRLGRLIGAARPIAGPALLATNELLGRGSTAAQSPAAQSPVKSPELEFGRASFAGRNPVGLDVAGPISVGRKPAGSPGFGPARRRFLVPVAVCAILLVSVVVAALPIAQPSNASSATTLASLVAESSLGTGPSLDPSASASTSPTAAPTLPPRSAAAIPGSVFLSYTVRAGDNLGRIARAFSLSQTTLFWANTGTIRDPQMVKIGQVLLIPPMDGLVIETAAGDTLQTIADKYGTSTQVIVDANGLTGTTLAAGQPLLIPGAETPALPTPKIPTVTPRPPNWLGKLAWPAPSHHNITQYFGCTGWYGEPRWGSCRHYHDGLDIGAPYGSPVDAAATGTVIYAGWRKAGTDGAAGGIVVWISHGGTLYTTYNHMSAVTVKAGQRVVKGQRIGSVGATGAAVGAHLHFEVWVCYPWTGGNISCARNPLLYAPNRR
jgi:murein DD-endopeptidase MepM/ murein hydrolase activator NlpD